MAGKRTKEYMALQEIAEDLWLYSLCPLRKTATHAVPGEGSGKSGVVFIGEAPGKNEDLTGRPFVGAAGKILDEMLQAIGLKREDVFITSIEKFRPPNNRVPNAKEIEACFPFLLRQLEVLKPSMVVTLGSSSLRQMLSFEKDEAVAVPSMQKFHGKKILGNHGYAYLPMFHPAAVLYQRSVLQDLKQDFAKLKKFV